LKNAPIARPERRERRGHFATVFNMKPKPHDTTLLFDSLSLLLNSRVAIGPALEALFRQTRGSAQRWIGAVKSHVERGESFASALALSGFSQKATLQLITVGEQSGHLPLCLQRIATLEQRKRRFLQRAQTALVYPAFVLVAATAVLFFLNQYILPQMSALSEHTSALPQTLFVALLAFFATAAIARIVAAFSPRFHSKAVDGLFRCATRIPLIRNLLASAAIAQWAYFLKTFLEAGSPFIQSVQWSCEIFPKAINDPFQVALARLKEGVPLSQSLQSVPFFPPTALLLLSTGEKSEQLPSALGALFDQQEQSAESHLNNLLTLLPPLSITLLALLVGAIAYSLFEPLTSFQM